MRGDRQQCDGGRSVLPVAILCAMVLAAPGQQRVPLTPQKPAPPTVATIGPLGGIVAPPANYSFPDGQGYVFMVEWHFFDAGTATVRMETAGTERHVNTVADTAGVVNMIFGVHDRFQAAFDPKTFCSLRVKKHTEEGFRKRETEIVFDYAQHKSVLNETNLKTKEKKSVENDIPGCITDVVTGFYYLASLALGQGESYTFPMNDGGMTAYVRAQVEGTEQVKTPSGTYATVRVTAEAISGTLKGRGKVWIWYTDDANHMPVQMRARLTWGSLLFRLQRVDRPKS
jgi:hypothetical protein